MDRKYSSGIINYATFRALASDREGGLATRAYQEYIDFAKMVALDIEKRIQRGGF
jgi:hypothetical protein